MNAQNIYYHAFKTSLGTMVVGCTKDSITHLQIINRDDIPPDWPNSDTYPAPETCPAKNTSAHCLSLAETAVTQIREYLEGKRRKFTLPLAPQGTLFQQKVWKALRTIPYGETRCYSEIAETIGNPKACRAVGMANNRNPIMILIPCHRVVGKNGSLVGYASGLDIKQRLLKLEGGLP